MSKHRRRILFAALAVLWLSVMLRGRQRDGESSSNVASDRAMADHAPKTPRKSSNRVAPAAAPADPFDQLNIEQGDLIANVHVEKSRVCPDEDFAVEAEPLPSAREIDFNIGGNFGRKVILRSNDPGVHTYHALATDHAKLRDDRQFEVEVLAETAPECAAKPRARIQITPSSEPSALILEAVPIAGLVPPLSLQWDFGDGQTVATSQRQIRHSYQDRVQASEFSSYVLGVDIVDAQGKRASARASAYFPNPRYLARKYSGNRVIPVKYDGLPRPRGAGQVFEVKFHNTEALPIAFDRATLSLRACGDRHEVAVRELAPGQLTSIARMDVGEESVVEFKIPQQWIADDVCWASVQLFGDTEPALTGTPFGVDGVEYQAVNAELTLELRPPGEQREQPQPVDDPQLLAKLGRAVRLLGTNRITPAQLEALELSGALEPEDGR